MKSERGQPGWAEQVKAQSSDTVVGGEVFEPLTSYREYPVEEMDARSRDFAADLARRRTVRQSSDRPVPRSVVEACLETAGTAPSGVHLQPWHFVVVGDPAVVRLTRGRISEDSTYSEEPPWQVRPPGIPVRGTLQVSYCRRDGALCRSARLPVDLSE